MRKEYDLSNAKPLKEFPHYDKLQAALKGKSRITIMLDNMVIEGFKDLAEKKGIGYQTLINQALREYARNEGEDLEETLRRVVREELKKTG